MKSIQVLLVAAVATVFLSSCYKRNGWGIRGKGETIKEVRDISGFSRIRLTADADVSYTQDSVYRVEVSAQSNILSITETRVEGDELVLGFKRNVWEHNK